MQIYHNNISRGSSLLELLLTISIVSIVLCLGISSVRQFTGLTERVQLDCAAKMVASDIRLLQQQAINSGKAHNYAIRYFRTDPHHYDLIDGTKLLKQVVLKDCGYKKVKFFGAPY